MTIDKCRTCKNAFATGKDILYCKKSLADKDDCGEYSAIERESKTECERKQLINELSKMPPMVIATAYLHAINYTLYGEDVTEKWLTATQQASALEQAYKKGYYDALQRQAESEDKCKNCEYYRNPDYTRCHECEAERSE